MYTLIYQEVVKSLNISKLFSVLYNKYEGFNAILL